MRTDFDHKLIGGDVEQYLTDNKVRLESSPPYRQHQNGLVEHHWQTIVAMACNWLKSAMLPAKYWYFAIKRASEVTNILPVKRGNKIITPHKEVYGRNVDYRVLFPMFSVAYIRQHHEDGKNIKSWVSKTLKCIVVGTCNKSDGLIFYHPPSKQTLTCGNGYRFDTFSPPRPQFGQQYEGDFIFNTKAALTSIHKPPTHEENSKVYYKTSLTPDTYEKATILSIPIDDDEEPYTVQNTTSGEILQLLSEELLDHDPSIPPSNANASNQQNSPFPNFPWITPNAKRTLYLPTTMKKPKQGFMQYDATTSTWSFKPGHAIHNKNNPIALPNFPEIVKSMIENKKLFKGWVTSDKVVTARQIRATSNILAGLIITLLKHYKLHPNDMKIWDAA